MKIFNQILLLTVLFTPIGLRGQVTIGSDTPPRATLDVVASETNAATAVGIIAPRLTGDELKAKDDLYTTAQTGVIVYVTAATSTASTKTTNITDAGYYYFDGTVWQSLKGASSGGASPWNVAGTTDPASENTQNIYQMGSVGIGSSNPNTSAALEIASSNKGFLPPRVTLNSITDVTTIPNPVEGLLVYSHSFDQPENNTTRTFPEGIYMYDGEKWAAMIASNDNTSGRPVRNRTGALIQVHQSTPVALNARQSLGLLLSNAHATITPTFDFGNWSPTTKSTTDVITNVTNNTGDAGAMLVEQKKGGMLTYWRLGFEYVLGNNPPTETKYFKVDIEAPNGGIVYSEAIVVPGRLDTGHTAPFSLFFATIADPQYENSGYRIMFGVDTAASQGLPNNIYVRLKQILKID